MPVVAESNMDSTGLVLRTRDVKVFHVEPHCTLRGSSFTNRLLIVRAQGQGSESKGRRAGSSLVLLVSSPFSWTHRGKRVFLFQMMVYSKEGCFVLLPLPLVSFPGLVKCHRSCSPHGEKAIWKTKGTCFIVSAFHSTLSHIIVLTHNAYFHARQGAQQRRHISPQTKRN